LDPFWHPFFIENRDTPKTSILRQVWGETLVFPCQSLSFWRHFSINFSLFFDLAFGCHFSTLFSNMVPKSVILAPPLAPSCVPNCDQNRPNGAKMHQKCPGVTPRSRFEHCFGVTRFQIDFCFVILTPLATFWLYVSSLLVPFWLPFRAIYSYFACSWPPFHLLSFYCEPHMQTSCSKTAFTSPTRILFRASSFYVTPKPFLYTFPSRNTRRHRLSAFFQINRKCQEHVEIFRNLLMASPSKNVTSKRRSIICNLQNAASCTKAPIH
jgi:hypothetical protein